MAQQDWSTVGKPVRKKDAMALLLGRPAYLDDLTPKDCLVVKVLRSPHAHALIEEIDTENAEQIPGVAAIFTYRDVPQKRFTMAGQTYPEPSPYDRLILDRRVRFVGDAVAIVAGENEAAVDRALKRIRVRYQVLEPVLDFHTAKDNLILVHPEESWRSLCPVGRTTAGTCVPARPVRTGMWTGSWPAATRWWRESTTPRPASRP